MGATMEIKQPAGSGRAARAELPSSGGRDRLQRTVVVYGYRRPGAGDPLSMVPGPTERWRLEAWTRQREWRLAMVVEEHAWQARPLRREALRGVVDRVTSRDIDGLVVPSLAHLAASPQQALAVIELILAAGGVFASVAEALDLSTATGRRRYLLLCRVCASGRSWPSLAGRER
jgi:resolvase-like protein